MEEVSRKVRAIALISGGLDSILAAKVLMNQGIEVIGLNFTSPFWTTNSYDEFYKKISIQNNFIINNVEVENDYYEMVRKPLHGHGKHINPCIDCKIYMLRMAKNLMSVYHADFIVTGEVLGQRPMSQMRDKLRIIEKESGLEGYLLRPLSAKLLPETIPEINGLVDRSLLLDINGRTRKIQNQLKELYGITYFSPPAGGCLLTEIHYERKMIDYFNNYDSSDKNKITLLRYGRHFRYKGKKIIVGRNNIDNEMILKYREDDEIFMEVPDIGSPVTLVESGSGYEVIEFAAQLTALYSDAETDTVSLKVFCGDNEKDMIKVNKTTKEIAELYNLAL